MLRMTGLFIYPVKGLAGVSLTAAAVEPWGLRDDRRWMVVDAAGLFVSQRQTPAMALIGTTLVPGGLRLTASGQAPLEVAAPPADAPRVPVVVWHDTVAATPAGPAADAWLSTVLGAERRLVFMADPAQARPVDPAFSTPEDRVSFADAFPLLVTRTASLADLNARLSQAVPMDRFRANLVVEDDGGPWAEDGWRRLRVGDVTFRVAKDCGRCAVPTVDQATGQRADDNEPIRTLARFRRLPDGRIIFGQNLIPEHPGTVRVGDTVTAL